MWSYIIGVQARSTGDFTTSENGFIPSGQKAQGILPPESYHRSGYSFL